MKSHWTCGAWIQTIYQKSFGSGSLLAAKSKSLECAKRLQFKFRRCRDPEPKDRSYEMNRIVWSELIAKAVAADHFANSFFRPVPASPRRPVPSSSRVAGSGTGATSVPCTTISLKSLSPPLYWSSMKMDTVGY